MLKLVEQHEVDKAIIEQLSQGMFGVTVRDLNKLQASGLIDQMLEDYGGKRDTRPMKSTPPRRQYSNGGTR